MTACPKRTEYRNPKLLKAAKGQECTLNVPENRLDRIIKKRCLHCDSDFIIPICRDWREHCCSSECKTAYREAWAKNAKESRFKSCARCGNGFYPRQNQIDAGQGKYCSLKCSSRDLSWARHTPEATHKRVESFKKAILDGRYIPKAKENNPRWMGGVNEYIKRQKEKRMAEKNRESAAKLRSYRNKNPDKAREFVINRRERLSGVLPRGTIKKIGDSQKWKCVICRCCVKDKYHTDHINPLARGGKNEPKNIQILCPQCNMKKSAKDPIAFMQENGYLL